MDRWWRNLSRQATLDVITLQRDAKMAGELPCGRTGRGGLVTVAASEAATNAAGWERPTDMTMTEVAEARRRAPPTDSTQSRPVLEGRSTLLVTQHPPIMWLHINRRTRLRPGAQARL